MLALISFLAVAIPQAKADFHAEIKFTLAGGEVGVNDYDESADGAFKSVSSLNIAGTKIASTLTGKFKDGAIESYALKQSGQGPDFLVVLKSGKITAEVGKEHHEMPLTYKGNLFFSGWHPQLLRNLADNYRTDIGGKQKLGVFIFEAGKTVEIPTQSIPQLTGKRGGNTESAVGFELGFPGVNIDVYTVGDHRVDAWDVKSQQFRAIDSEVTGLFTDPIAAHPELSQATFKTKVVEGVSIPMRDGVHLVHDMMMPDAAGKYPVILERTPYGRGGGLATAAFYATRGYIVISQDTRGREGSDGEWDPMINERKDGYDTIEWIAKQPWCDGNIGMIGGSYGGYVQWAAAVEHPTALKCIVPQVSPPDAFLNIPYEYGTLPLLADLWWLNVVRNKQTDTAGILNMVPKPAGMLTLPLSKVPKAVFGYDLPIFNTWLKRDRMTDWKGFDIEKDVLSVKIPVLHISGWWDGDGIGTELHWTKLQATGKTNQWLIEGPWTHAFNTTTKLGEYDFGSGAIIDLDLVYLRWFDTWLKGKQAGLDSMPKARVFMTGENKWHETTSFPEASAKPAKWFLSAGGKLRFSPGTGSSKYAYDPHNAKVPELPKPFSTDHSMKVPAEKSAKDSLIFKSDPLPVDTSFEGSMVFKGYIKTDVVDTDLYVLLLDIAPDGTQMATVSSGKLKLEYRNGFDKPELMRPGKVYAVTVHPWWWAHKFKKGHRITIMIRSNGFPGTARNLNTGEPLLTATRMVTAHIEILHDKAHPSTFSWYRLP